MSRRNVIVSIQLRCRNADTGFVYFEGKRDGAPRRAANEHGMLMSSTTPAMECQLAFHNTYIAGRGGVLHKRLAAPARPSVPLHCVPLPLSHARDNIAAAGRSRYVGRRAAGVQTSAIGRNARSAKAAWITSSYDPNRRREVYARIYYFCFFFLRNSYFFRSSVLFARARCIKNRLRAYYIIVR